MLVGGLRLIMSTGQCSFCHAAFWGIGAYASTLLTMKLGLSFWIALPLSAFVAGVIAVPIGFPCFRLKGPYFVIITLAFGELIKLIEISWVSFLGGSNGISFIPFPEPISIPGLSTIVFESKTSFYYLLLPLVLISLYVFYRLETSRFGVACNAIREADDLAKSVGINVLRYKMIAFIAASCFAGVAGSFYSTYTSYISPQNFSIHTSLMLLVFMMVGGVQSVSGSIIGTVVMCFLTELLRSFDQYEPLFYGLVLVLVLIFMRGGLLGLIKRVPTGTLLGKYQAKSIN